MVLCVRRSVCIHNSIVQLCGNSHPSPTRSWAGCRLSPDSVLSIRVNSASSITLCVTPCFYTAEHSYVSINDPLTKASVFPCFSDVIWWVCVSSQNTTWWSKECLWVSGTVINPVVWVNKDHYAPPLSPRWPSRAPFIVHCKNIYIPWTVSDFVITEVCVFY